MHELLFLNPCVNVGDINLTVRLGDKWLKQANVGDNIVICKTPEEEGGTATATQLANAVIVGQMFLPFSQIPPSLLKLEHDPECRSFAGLVRAMTAAYGTSFDINTADVTLLFFKVTEDKGC